MDVLIPETGFIQARNYLFEHLNIYESMYYCSDRSFPIAGTKVAGYL